MKRIITIFLLLTGPMVWAQKKAVATAEPLSEEAQMKAEMALIDGQKHLILENYAKALEMFHVAAEINPNDAAVHFKIAEVLYRNGAFDEAIVSAERAVALQPDNKYYYLLAAEIHVERSDLASAQKVYEELLKRPGNEEHLTELATIYLYQGKDQKALETLGQAQDRFGTNEAIVQEKQRIYMKLGQLDKVVAEWERLVREEPWREDHVYTLVDILITNGDLPKAEKYLQDLQSNGSADGRAGLMLAEILKKQGRTSEALGAARKALLSPTVEFDLKGGILNDLMKSVAETDRSQFLELVREVVALHPRNHIAQAFAGDVFFQQQDKPGALEFYRKSVRLVPDNYAVWQNILSLEAELEQFDSLVVHAEQALEYYPNQAAVYYFAGTGYLRKKNYRQASQLLEMGKRYALDDKLRGVFWGQLGDAYNGLKDFPKSENAYEEALKLDANNEHVLNNYSYFLTMRKTQLDKALTLSTRLIGLRADSPTYLDTHGWVLFVKGEYKESRKYLEKAVAIKPSATLLEHYGDVLYKLGEEDAAVEQWEKAAALSENPGLLKKIADRKYYE